MNHKSRLAKLEKQRGESAPFVGRVYFHDREKGYAARAGGPHFETFAALAEAQGWATRESDLKIKITRASQAEAIA